VWRLAVCCVIGAAGCDFVWSVHEFPVPVHGGRMIGNPKGDFDGDGTPNDMDGCPAIDSAVSGGRSDQDHDGVPDICDPNPTIPGDCVALFDDFSDPTLSPLWQYDGNPIVVVRNDPIFMNRPYLQFDAADDEVIYLDKLLDLDAVSARIYAQAGDNPAPDQHAIELYVDLTHSALGRAEGEACAVQSSNGNGMVEHVRVTAGADTILASTPGAPDALRVGAGNTFTVEWGAAAAPKACSATTDPTEPSLFYAVDATVPPSGTFAIRGRNVGLFILAVVGWGHNCAAN